MIPTTVDVAVAGAGAGAGAVNAADTWFIGGRLRVAIQ